VSAAVVDIAFRRRAMNTAVQSPPAQGARDAERMAREIGDRWFLAIAIADLAHVVIAQGRLDEAAAIVRRIDTVPAPSDLEWLIKRHAARGKLAAQQGHAEHGVADARARGRARGHHGPARLPSRCLS